jgi:hypothetical protein
MIHCQADLIWPDGPFNNITNPKNAIHQGTGVNAT